MRYVAAPVRVGEHLYAIVGKCAPLRGKSSLVLNYTRSSVERTMGRIRWMDEAELLTKYGDQALVSDLIAKKKSAGNMKPNPDFPDKPERNLYKCFDSAVEEHEENDSRSRSLTIKGDVSGPQLPRPWAIGVLGVKLRCAIALGVVKRSSSLTLVWACGWWVSANTA